MADTRVADLFKAKDILANDIDAAVASYLKKPSPGPVALGDAYTVDVDAAIEEHKKRVPVWPGDDASGLLRTMVRTAIILGTPEKA